MPGVHFQTLREAISIGEVLRLLDCAGTQRGGEQWRGACPVHGSQSAASRVFSVNLKTNRYYCHKCHSHGNALELWAAVHRLNIHQAAIDLCRALGREVPWMHHRQPTREEAPVVTPPITA